MVYLMLTMLSFLIVILLIPVVILLCRKYGIYDRNNAFGGRQGKISRLGGTGIFLSFMITNTRLIDSANQLQIYCVLIAVFLLFILGLYDDIFNSGPGVKFFIQIIIAYFAVVYGHVKYLPYHSDSSLLNDFSENVFSVFLLVYVINAFNLIDGIDGLAALLGALINLFLGVALAIHGEQMYAGMAFILFGTLTGFLVFNFSPARVFMGDSGSMVTGFISTVVALRFMALNHDILNAFYIGPVVVFALFIVPLYDTFRVFFIRIWLRKSPFKGDQNHIHHRLSRLGFQNHQVIFLLTCYTVFVVLFAIILRDMSDLVLLFVLLLLSITLNSVLDFHLKRNLNRKNLIKNI